MTRRTKREVRRTYDPLDRKRRVSVRQRDARREDKSCHRDMTLRGEAA